MPPPEWRLVDTDVRDYQPEPRTWYVRCGVHVAASSLCPPCLDTDRWAVANATVQAASTCRG